MPNDKQNDLHATPSEGKLPWVHPKVESFEAREAEAAVVYGGPDLGFYHS